MLHSYCVFETESDTRKLWLGDWRSCPAVDVQLLLPFLLLGKSLQWSSRHVLLFLVCFHLLHHTHSCRVTMDSSLIIWPQLEPIKVDGVQRFLNLSLNSVAGWVFCYWGWGACLWWHTGELTDIEQNCQWVSVRMSQRACTHPLHHSTQWEDTFRESVLSFHVDPWDWIWAVRSRSKCLYPILVAQENIFFGTFFSSYFWEESSSFFWGSPSHFWLPVDEQSNKTSLIIREVGFWPDLAN